MVERLKSPWLLSLPLLCLASTGTAIEIEAALDAAIGRSDNVARSVTDEVDETLVSVGTQFLFTQDSARLKADLIGDLAFIDYLGDTFKSDLLGEVSANVRLVMFEDTLEWSVQERFGQARQNLQSALTPDNRQNINFLSTGPDLLLGLGSSFDLRLRARYGRVDRESDVLSSERYIGSIGIERRLSEARSISLVLSEERTRIPDSSGDDYDIQEAIARFASNGSATQLTLDAGGSRVQGSSVSDSGALFRAELQRRFGARSTFVVRLAHEFTNAGTTFGAGHDGIDSADGASSLALVNDPFISRQAELGWRIEGRRTTLDLRAGYFAENLIAANGLDRKRHVFSFSADRRLGSRLQARARFSQSAGDFSGSVPSTRETTVDVGVAWRIGSLLSIDADASRNTFSTAGDTAAENRYWLRFRYGNRLDNARAAQ